MLITEFESLSHNRTDWTEAFAAAVAALRRQGGGVLTVPPGEYLTGSIRLDSHMTLDIQNGAFLRFLQDEGRFPLIDLEFEGIGGMVHQPCIYAENAQRVKITGDGTVDGQGDFWWQKVRNRTLSHPRPLLIGFTNCRDVTLENLFLTNSPAWTVHPLRSSYVTIRNLNIKNPADSPNTDGINPEGCQDVKILGCTIDVGDDCIAIKSGTEDTQNRQACDRILISGCHFLHGHGGVVIGSEMSGNIRNVLVNGCIFYQTDRGIRLKTRRGRGGVVEGIHLSNLIMEEVMCPFVFNMYYFCGKDGKMKHVWDKNPHPVSAATPVLRNVRITNVVARKCTACAGFFYGLAEMPVRDVTLQNVTVEMAVDGEPGFPAMMDGCPRMQGEGLYMRNVQNASISGMRVTGAKGDWLNRDGSVVLEGDEP